MNTRMKTRRQLIMVFFTLLAWLPMTVMAQTVQYEMVVEKTDGTELAFKITDDYPLLQYMCGGEDGVNTMEIQTANGYTSVPCPEIKRLFTREAKAIRGDITGSGMVDAADIAVMVNYLLGKPTSTGSFNEEAADVNGAGVVNVADVVQIANIILGN